MRLAVCDDDKYFLQALEAKLRTFPFVEQVATFSRAESLFAELAEGTGFDALLMDIDLGEEHTGLEYAGRLYRLAPHLPVIYVTGYNDRFCQWVLLSDANLAGYLTKPVDDAMLGRYLSKVLRSQAEARNLTFRQQGVLHCVCAERIIYVESRNHTVLIHTEETTYTVYEKLDDILARLPESFHQCHKSYLVNLRWIQRMEAGRLLLRNGETVRVSRAFAAGTRDRVFRFMGLQI